MTAIKVSVLMPAYNSEKYIEEAIQSILNQTLKDFELIIIDDGSTDQTWEIIKRFALTDKRLIVFQNEKNLGISTTRNKLLGLATGKYVAWQDSDDVSVPQRLEWQVHKLDKCPEIGVIGGSLSILNENGESSIRKYPTSNTELRKVMFRYSPVAQPASMVRRQLFAQAGCFNEALKVAEDLDLIFRLATITQMTNLDETVLIYRLSGNSSTIKNLRSMEYYSVKIRLKYLASGLFGLSINGWLFNTVHLLSLWLIPSKFKYSLYSRLRDSKI